MTAFITDRDLLAYEPHLFIDLPISGQQSVEVSDASVNGTTLTTATGGLASLAAGDVLVLTGDGLEPLTLALESVTDDSTGELANVPAELGGMSGLTVSARSFRPQVELTHAELMRRLSLDPDDPAQLLDESSVVSVSLVKCLEALGTLKAVFEAGQRLGGDNEHVLAKAGHYARRYEAALRSAAVLIDTDGDGVADVIRHPAAAALRRV